ncbi:GNAT family N-acetyltransferase [Clostridium frigidicarnis]|uniref:Acetyltransferase (GNAT) domain-containing protein n=1 Tax=Clostridium frigidicarnis TaxID=84698 RepID=A0A1I0ZX94_9CLOT|nr:GNAT family N-acetyltransferase [Clostridium frigidicarnis]SFB30384.1 Acetyltransferase (GNAT) domain-containing protein [Clostridium frigidicarnis]
MKFIRMNDVKSTCWSKAWKIYINSFPLFEQRKIEDQIEILKDYRYHCIVVCEEESIIGILFYWEWDNYIYIEHLAISSDLRGRNYGSKILKEFCKNNKCIILEIDPPVDDISIKRLKFYSNLEFRLQEFDHVHPPYRKGYKGHNLKVLGYNIILSKRNYDDFNTFLKEEIMKC